jgi:hypothetical protein
METKKFIEVTVDYESQFLIEKYHYNARISEITDKTIYGNFDDKGNWLEKIIYNGYNSGNEKIIREIDYYH